VHRSELALVVLDNFDASVQYYCLGIVQGDESSENLAGAIGKEDPEALAKITPNSSYR
jgi:hypothetical protein